MIRHRPIQTEPAEPPVGQIEVDLIAQPPLRSDSEDVRSHRRTFEPPSARATNLEAFKIAGIWSSRQYELVEHQLTPEQVRIYDAYADAFIHNNLDAAMRAANVTARPER